MLFADVVAASAAVAASPRRNGKRDTLAEVLVSTPVEFVPAVVGLLTGEVRQGRIGVGWGIVGDVEPPPAVTATLTVATFDDVLSAVAATAGPGSVASRKELLWGLLATATEDEQGFIRRILTGNVRQGALDGVMVDAIARAAQVPVEAVRRAHMLGGDLGRVAAVALSGGLAALDGVGLVVGRPVRPMLAASSASVADAIRETGLASVEWKLDGARIQVHGNAEEVRVFTRNLNDVTDRLTGVVDVVKGLPLTSCVLDGETLGLDDEGRPRLFQDTMSRFGADMVPGDQERFELRPWFFDVLHLDGVDLIDLPLGERRRLLEGVAPRWCVPAVRTADPCEAETFFESTVALGHEGVVVKALDASYEAGRRGASWRKVKPVHTLDLVVLAAEWGHGRRTGWLSNLHLGARDPAGGFIMVGKTFKGLTDELLQWQTDQFLARAVAQDRRVVQVRPELVVEVALDGVQISRRYPGGVALRFARVKRYRPDKTPDDADTIEVVQALAGGRA